MNAKWLSPSHLSRKGFNEVVYRRALPGVIYRGAQGG